MSKRMLDSECFLSDYFQDVINEIDIAAELALQKIQNDREQMIAQVKKTHMERLQAKLGDDAIFQTARKYIKNFHGERDAKKHVFDYLQRVEALGYVDTHFEAKANSSSFGILAAETAHLPYFYFFDCSKYMYRFEKKASAVAVISMPPLPKFQSYTSRHYDEKIVVGVGKDIEIVSMKRLSERNPSQSPYCVLKMHGHTDTIYSLVFLRPKKILK